MVKVKKILARMHKELWVGPRRLKAAFSSTQKAALTQAIKASEEKHNGEIRVIVEGRLPLTEYVTGVSPRQRAVELFTTHHVWDTEQNSGVLVYLLMSEPALEIVTDRGLKGACINADESTTWEEVFEKLCAATVFHFRNGKYDEGLIQLIEEITPLLALHFPPRVLDANELADEPIIS